MASNAPRRSLRSNHVSFQNSPTLSQSELAAEGSSSQVKRRGRAVNKKKYKVQDENRGVVPIQFDDEYEKPVRSYSEIWETELGIIARENIPLHYKDWVDVPEFERQSLYNIIKKEFGVDCNMDSKAREAADLSMSTAFRKHRYRLKEHFDKFETEEIGRRNPYSRVDAEDWQMMCDRWKTEKFQKMSARNKVNRKKLKVLHCAGSKSYAKIHYQLKTSSNDEHSDEDDEHRRLGPAIQMYEKTHFKEGTGWIHDDARKTYEDMTAEYLETTVNSDGNLDGSNLVPIDEVILENHLGTSKGRYFRGFGYGKKASSLSSSSRRRKANAELERRLERAERERDEVKGKLSQVEENVNELKASMDSILQYQMKMSSQLVYGACGPPICSPQQQQPFAFGPFGSYQYLQPPFSSQQPNPTFGPDPPVHSQSPTNISMT